MEEKTDLEENFSVLFWGNFIPLQGIEYIIQAAKKLEDNFDIKFQIIGGGQAENDVMKLAEELRLNNLVFIERIALSVLPDFIRKADACLGIFGSTDKATRVIPNKVYEAIAMGKPVISGDTPAIRELFTDRENILLCQMADSDDLAEKILELKNNPELREKIAGGGYELFLERATPKVIGQELLDQLQKIL